MKRSSTLLPLILVGVLGVEHGHAELLAIVPGDYASPAPIAQDSTGAGTHHLPMQSSLVLIPSST